MNGKISLDNFLQYLMDSNNLIGGSDSSKEINEQRINQLKQLLESDQQEEA